MCVRSLKNIIWGFGHRHSTPGPVDHLEIVAAVANGDGRREGKRENRRSLAIERLQVNR